MNYNIEIATISNLNEIFDLQDNYEHSLISKSILEKELTNDQYIYFIAKNIYNEILGSIGVSILVDHLDISILITNKKYTRNGIASSLLNTIINYCKKNDIHKILLEVRKTNIAAINLYEKFNFRQIHIRKNYYTDNNEDALIYMLEI